MRYLTRVDWEARLCTEDKDMRIILRLVLHIGGLGNILIEFHALACSYVCLNSLRLWLLQIAYWLHGLNILRYLTIMSHWIKSRTRVQKQCEHFTIILVIMSHCFMQGDTVIAPRCSWCIPYVVHLKSGYHVLHRLSAGRVQFVCILRVTS